MNQGIWTRSLGLLVIAVVLLANTVAESAEKHTTDTLPMVKKAVAEKKAVLVDVREQDEWNDGHIKGATHLPLSKLQNSVKAEDLAKTLSKDKIIYCHCARGARSLKAAELLKKLGYEVRALKSGFDELLKAGFDKE